MASFRFGPVADRGYADQLVDLVREWTLSNVFDDFGRFARNPVQPRDPRITPVGTTLGPEPPPQPPIGNAPPPGSNPPIVLPTPDDPYPFVPGSVFYGSKGPRTRRRRGRAREYHIPGYFPPGPWDCTSDSECYEECLDKRGDPALCENPPQPPEEDWHAPPVDRVIEARGPMPDTAPPPVLPRVLPRILGRVFGPVGYIFWPSETADDDVITNPELLPQPLPKGPARRPRVRTPVRRDAPERDKPPTVGPHPVPTDLPVELPAPTPTPTPSSLPTPSSWPTPSPTSWPTPSPLPSPPAGAPAWMPFLPLLPFLWNPPARGARPGRMPRPGSNPRPVPGPAPLTAFQPQPLPSRTSDCTDVRRPKRKRSPRTECYRGTYTELRNGLLKRKRERIKCR
ncbi:MAG TPA: hypothetical protein VGK73_17095 [Polyangiaceae bacterium]